MTLRSRLLLVGAAVALFSMPAPAQVYRWNTTNGGFNTAGNWLDEGGGPAVPVSSATTTLVFSASGATGYTATNDIGDIGSPAFTLNTLRVNNTGTGTVTIAQQSIPGTTPTPRTLTFAGTDPTLDITGTVLFTGLFTSGSPTLIKTGPGTFIHDSNNGGFTGQLIINGGSFINDATVNATTNFNPTSIVVNNSGTYQFGVNTAGNPNLPNSTYITVNPGGTVIWEEGEDFGGIDLNGGTLNLRVAGYNAQGSRAQVWTSGTVTGGAFAASGTGTASNINKTTAGTVTVTGGASLAGSGVLAIQAGTISFAGAANLAGTKPVTLGTIGAGATSGTIEYQGATVTRGGTLTLNDGGGTIRVTDPAAVLTLSGPLSGTGPLTKEGPGTLAFTGALNQSGLTTVAAGTVQVGPVTSSGSFAVNSGATFAVNAGAGTASATVPGLSLAAGGAAVRFDLNAPAPPAGPLLTVSGFDGLNLNGGTHTLAVTNAQPFVNGSYRLIDYAGAPITGGFNLLLPGRTAGSLGYDTANTEITLNVTGTDSVVWTGAVNGDWDRGTAAGVGGTNNFRLATAGTPTNFIDTDVVRFDDTATRFTVNLTAAVQPAGVTVDNAANTFTVQGPGAIAGPTGLVKRGAGTLVLATDNTYTGATVVEAGTLRVGGGGTAGTLGAGPTSVAAGATLAFDRSTDSAYAGSITGAGEITKAGAGTLTLLGSNGFTGTFTINGGTVALDDRGGGGDLNATNIVVNNGGRFSFGPSGSGNPDLPGGTVITVNPGGVAEFAVGEDYGAINLRGGTYNSRVNNNLGLQSGFESGTLANPFGTGAGSLGGAGEIRKTTAGTVTVTGVALNNTGGLTIEQGVLSTDSAIGGSGAITFGTAGTGATTGTLQYRGPTADLGRAVTLNAGGGVLDVTQAGTAVTLSGIVSGTGPLTKAGPGTLALTGTNTYTGTTTVAGGTLLVSGNNGAATGGVAVNPGGLLGGAGTVGGAVTVNAGTGGAAGGAIRGGAPNSADTLTVANSVTLTGAAGGSGARLVVDFNSTAGTANSRLAVTGTGSTLNLVTTTGPVRIQLVNDGALAAGQTYSNVVLAAAPAGSAVLKNGQPWDATTNPFVHGTDFTLEGVSTPGFAGVPLLSVSGGDLVLTFAPVPEPGTVLAVAAGALGAGGWVRRRLRRGVPA